VGRHPPVRGDLQHVTQAVIAHCLPQLRVGAIDLIAGHPRSRDTGLHGAGNHRRGKRRLGRKTYAVRDSGVGAALLVRGPGSRQVQGPVDQGMPTLRGVGEEHRDLRVLDPPRRAGVLALHANRLTALLDVPSFIDHEDGAGVGEGVDHVAAQVVTDRVGVPLRAGEKMLQPIRREITAMLGDRPAVLAIQTGQHPQHQPASMAQRLIPREPRRDPIDHRAVRHPPPVRIYAASRGHRGASVVRHKHRMLAR
jgi:hypothetical protein